MSITRSIRFRLSSVFAFFLLLVIVFGAFSIERLSNFNGISADIRDRWLPSTRYLGDLNNFTSDFRAAEAGRLLSATPAERAGIERTIDELDRQVSLAEHSYEHVFHDAEENRLYAQFAAEWRHYREVADQVMGLAADGKPAEASGRYMAQSRAAYDAASDTLGLLTDRNAASARDSSNRADAAYKEAMSLSAMAMALAALMAGAAIVYTRRAISEPLLNLVACMRRIAANEGDVRILFTERHDEIGEMARAVVVFRDTAVDLAISQAKLAHQASMLEERLAQEQRLTSLQRNFVSMASHEFRTPLTVIDGHAQRLVVMKDRLGPQEIVERAGKVRGAVLRMTNLIDSLLSSSRLVDGKAELYFHPEEIDLATLLRDVCRLHREVSPWAQIGESFGQAPLPLTGDPKLLFQAFSNLLANAIKYSPGGGLIKVRGRQEEGGIAVTVADRGVGIPQGDVEHLFERYYRGSNVSGIVGTGIGLYFVKMVVDLHGGEVAVASAEGEGARFTVRLPAAPSAPADADLLGVAAPGG
jgi:signal transduction histidine kinase